MRRGVGRSLQARLALAYAVGIFAAGTVALVIVDVPLAGVDETEPVHRSAPAAVTGSGHGIGPHQLLLGSAAALAVLVPAALALGWFVAGRFLDPLRAITGTARLVSAGSLHQRLDLGEPTDELTELGHTLDGLFARLETAFDAQRHFVANASHELRTLLEVALADPDADAETLREVCREALALGAHQERLVEALLVLATSERGVSRRDVCDLAEIARRVIASRRAQASERTVELSGHLAPAVTAGDPGLIESLIANLVDNAIRHNHPGGQTHISTGTSGPWAGITVANTGPVVPEDQLRRLFEPFQRLSADRRDGSDARGLGLGLAIVDAVARAHHAALTADARPEGGLDVTVRFTHARRPEPGLDSQGTEPAPRAGVDVA